MRAPITIIDANTLRRAGLTPLISILAGLLFVIAPSISLAKVDGETIVLGATVSLSGNYATLGLHTKNGYDLAASTINKKGGVKVKGKSYKLKIMYYDDESDPKL